MRVVPALSTKREQSAPKYPLSHLQVPKMHWPLLLHPLTQGMGRPAISFSHPNPNAAHGHRHTLLSFSHTPYPLQLKGQLEGDASMLGSASADPL